MKWVTEGMYSVATFFQRESLRYKKACEFVIHRLYLLTLISDLTVLSYSTVTLFAKFRGWSTSVPLINAT